MSAAEEPKRRGRPPSGGREAILDAAVALVREEGIAKLTSREIAARAGVSDASVYYHFGDRRGLLQAVYAHGMKPLSYMEELPAGIDHEVVLRRAFESLEAFFDEALPIIRAAQADADVGQALAGYIEENDLGPHKGVSALGTYLRGEQAAGRVNPEADVDAVALLVIDAAFSRVARGQMMRPDDDDERLPSPERLLATINRLLSPPSPRTR
jgi:AcrR family transcriptional regulator